jgi:predicted CopG family antitoxin
MVKKRGWKMSRKMTISVDEEVYHGLLSVVGKRKISRFISDLVRPHVVENDLEAGYKAMAADEEYEMEAQEWCSALVSDFHD